MTVSHRAQHEIEHGRRLAASGAEHIWGWGTPAGQIRARRRADLIASGARLGPGTRALEIGCGTGIFTEYFARTGAEIVALDISEELLEIARNRSLPKTVTFVCAPFEALGSEQPFDAVIGSSVLHHLEIEPALVEIHRLLKPGGVMGFAEPNMLNPQIMIQKNVPWIKARMGDSPDETAFFRWQLARLMRDAGFVDVRTVPLDWLHPATPPRLIPTVQTLGYYLEKTPILREIAGSLYIFGRKPIRSPHAH